MLLIAHRGFRVGVHENTFDAFSRAFKLKMDYIECDVQLSRDLILYILHDATFDRTMGTSGLLSEYTSTEIDEITTPDGNWHVPRLEELLIYKKTHPAVATKLMIELKGENSGYATANLIKSLNLEEEVVFSGRYLVELKKAHAICPSIPLCLNITKCKEFTVEDLMRVQSQAEFPIPFAMISLKTNRIRNSEFFSKCLDLNIKGLCWNFLDYDSPEHIIQKMCDWGAHGLLLDDPETINVFNI